MSSPRKTTRLQERTRSRTTTLDTIIPATSRLRFAAHSPRTRARRTHATILKSLRSPLRAGASFAVVFPLGRNSPRKRFPAARRSMAGEFYMDMKDLSIPLTKAFQWSHLRGVLREHHEQLPVHTNECVPFFGKRIHCCSNHRDSLGEQHRLPSQGAAARDTGLRPHHWPGHLRAGGHGPAQHGGRRPQPPERAAPTPRRVGRSQGRRVLLLSFHPCAPRHFRLGLRRRLGDSVDARFLSCSSVMYLFVYRDRIYGYGLELLQFLVA